MTPTQPDKRSAAFENIFGRPKPTQTTYDPTQYYAQQPQNVQRVSYPGSIPPGVALSPQPSIYALPQGAAPGPSPYRSSYYPIQAAPVQHVVQPQYYTQQHLIPQPPQQLPRRSPSPYTRPPGTIAPLPSQEPPDAGLEHLTRQGLTPAQAYQAQVYLNSPLNLPHQQPFPVQSVPDFAQLTPNPNHHILPGAHMTPYVTPGQITAIEDGMGSLGLSDYNSRSGHGEEDDEAGSSDLPWAAPEASRKCQYLLRILRLLTPFYQRLQLTGVMLSSPRPLRCPAGVSTTPKHRRSGLPILGIMAVVPRLRHRPPMRLAVPWSRVGRPGTTIPNPWGGVQEPITTTDCVPSQPPPRRLSP